MPDFFYPGVVGQIKNLEMRSLRLVESFLAGAHKSRILGISTEFAQHRQYVPGDDIKHLDWKVFARTERYHVKQYEAETAMQVYFLLDTSSSMFFKSDEAAMSKFDYAATTTAAIAYLLLQAKDSFGLMLFDEKPHTILKAKGASSHFRNVVALLDKAKPGGQTSLIEAIDAISARLNRKGLVVILSDFIDRIDQISLPLGRLSFMGQDVVLFHVEDPVEREFPFIGQSILIGLENEGKLLCDPRDLRNTYLRERARRLDVLQNAAYGYGFSFEKMRTDHSLAAALTGFLTLRQARKRVG